MNQPNWLDREFLENHLKHYYDDNNLKVLDFVSKSATIKGEGFCGSLYRIKITFVVKEHNNDKKKNILNIILKMLPPTEGVISNPNILEGEIEFYDKILPKIRNCLRKLDENDEIVPECYGVCRKNNAILMEDMCAKGYELLPVEPGFSLSETKVVIRSLALYHSILSTLQEEDPNIFRNLKYGVLSRETTTLNFYFLSAYEALLEQISLWPDFSSYAEKLKRISPDDFLENGHQVFDVNPTHFNTLVHGDLWTNNVLVLKDNEGIKNAVLIDFQFCCWSSPAVDLYFFINVAMCDALRPNHFDELIEFYYEHSTRNLKRLHYKKDTPTLHDFLYQMHKRSFCGFVTGCLEYPLAIVVNDEHSDFETVAIGNEYTKEFKRQMFASPKIEKLLRKMIPYYDELGAFD